MIETKKRLRILAGVFLLILAAFSMVSTAVTFFSGNLAGRISFFQTYWPVLLSMTFTILLAIFVFTRCYIGAGVVECVLVLYDLISVVSVFATSKNGYLPKGYVAFSVLATLFAPASCVLLLIAFFKHNRSAKPLFIVGGILAFVSAFLSGVHASALPLLQGYGATAERIGFLVGGIIGASLAGALSLLPWLFLGIYFGAQREELHDPLPEWGGPVPQEPYNAAPQQQSSSGVWKPYP